MHNPRQDPKATTNIAFGDNAIKMGSIKLGEMLAKCLSEVNLIDSLPPGPQSKMVLGLLKANLQRIMGITQGDDDDE